MNDNKTFDKTAYFNVITHGNATANGIDDDTSAFQTGLANARKVYVPGGTYKISQPLTITENSELVLSQNTILEFTYPDDTAEGSLENCIIMKGSASLKGNHAIVKVPYDFDGNVIRISTADEGFTHDNVPGFSGGGPMIKRGRYLSDLNIIKQNSEGHCNAIENTDCCGTAIFMESIGDKSENETVTEETGDDTTEESVVENVENTEATDTENDEENNTENEGDEVNTGTQDPIDFVWGLTFTGVRIAGAFSYGINVVNSKGGWNHEMRIEAIIEACEIGANLVNCNNAHLAVTVQPAMILSSYDKEGEELLKPEYSYAKYGIRLENCNNIDLTQSCVWDWTRANTDMDIDDKNDKYRHIAMYGICRGTILYDHSLANSNSSIKEDNEFENKTEEFNHKNSRSFWDSIYVENPYSMFSATVFGAKGMIPIDPKYAFYKNYRNGNNAFNTNNLSWRDYHNMVRYDVPVSMLNPSDPGDDESYPYKNRLYKIGYFTINGEVENPVRDPDNPTNEKEKFDDTLLVETITIEENNAYGLIGWSNIHCYVRTSGAHSISYRWNPLPSVYLNRVPIYYYSTSESFNPVTNETETTYTIYRLIKDGYDIQQVYNCRVSITNARRFIFDFEDMGQIDDLLSNEEGGVNYTPLSPTVDYNGNPRVQGMFALVDGKPVVCTLSGVYSETEKEYANPEVKELAYADVVENLKETVSDIEKEISSINNATTLKDFKSIEDNLINLNMKVTQHTHNYAGSSAVGGAAYRAVADATGANISSTYAKKSEVYTKEEVYTKAQINELLTMLKNDMN